MCSSSPIGTAAGGLSGGIQAAEKEIPFVLTNDEMDDKLWLGLVNNSDVFWKVFNAISNKLRFNAVDKKK